MKFCANCGSMIEENVKFCPNCGTAVAQPAEQPVQSRPVQQTAYQQAIEPDKYQGFPMKWYKFLAYFLLWFGAFINIVNGFLIITGKHYDISASREGLSEAVYRQFPALKAGDIVCGILILVVAVLGILAAVNLLRLKAIGPKLVIAVYAGGLFVTVLNIIFSLTMTKGMLSFGSILSPSVIGSIAGATLMLVINWIYFKKRESVFVN